MFQVNYKPGEEFTFRFRMPESTGKAGEAVDHARAAGKEALLSLRSILDGVIEVFDKKEGDGDQGQGRTKIEVD